MDGFDFMDQAALDKFKQDLDSMSSFDQAKLDKTMQNMSADFVRKVARIFEAFTQQALPLLSPYMQILWAGEEEQCLREYTRRMNAGPWRWRKRSWRRLNIEQRTAARRWWVSYGREALKWRQE